MKDRTVGWEETTQENRSFVQSSSFATRKRRGTDPQADRPGVRAPVRPDLGVDGARDRGGGWSAWS